MPKGIPGSIAYGDVTFSENPKAYQAARFQAIKADPEKYAARKVLVNAQRRGKGYWRNYVPHPQTASSVVK